MATLPEAFDKALYKAIEARAVWLPGTPVEIGDVLVRKKDGFNKIAHITSFGATAEVLPHFDRNLDLTSSKVKERLLQGNAELTDPNKLDLTADATVKYEFKGSAQFVLKAPTVSGSSVQNALEIATRLYTLANWKHDDYFIVEEVYTAADWSFLGTKETSTSVSFTGKGAAVLSFLNAGASVGLKSSGTIDVKILGKGGAIGMNVFRVKKNGSLRYDL